MTFAKAILLSALGLAPLAAASHAAGTASADLQVPIHIEAVQHLHFGVIPLARGQAGHVQVDHTGEAFHHFGAGRLPHRAALSGHFRVRGQRGWIFSVLLQPALELTGGNTRKTLKGRIHHLQVGTSATQPVPDGKAPGAFQSKPAVIMNPLGGVDVKLGATLTVPADAGEDHYQGDYAITVVMH